MFVVHEPVVAEISTCSEEIFAGMKVMFWTCTQLPFWALPLLTQEAGRRRFPFSRQNGKGRFPLTSQDRLDRGVKPEKRAPTFRAIVIFEVNPKMSGCWSFWGIFVRCLQPAWPAWAPCLRVLGRLSGSSPANAPAPRGNETASRNSSGEEELEGLIWRGL